MWSMIQKLSWKYFNVILFQTFHFKFLNLLSSGAGIVNFIKKSYPQISHVKNIIQKFFTIFFIHNVRDLLFITLYLMAMSKF